MRRDIFAGLVFCKTVEAVRLGSAFDMFPKIKYCSEEFVESQLAPLLGQTKAHEIVFKNSTDRKDELNKA